MDAGEDSKGKKIKPPYTERTKEIKKFKGQPTDRVTLEDEGDFKRRTYLEADQFPIFFRSADWKEPKLVEKYGEDIFGIQKKNLKSYTKEELKSQIFEWLKSLIRL